ncbi:MAG: hypothetical protein MI742_02010 [Desulfobacterales bacterium]|nr:hypothetical protein [Desulfobacterales bacterium]
MKKVKIALFVVLLIAIGGVVYQNLTFFATKHALVVDLKFWAYATPEVANGLLLLGCFLIGFLSAYLGGLVARFKSGKVVKELNAVIDSQQEKISTLRGEMDILKRRPVQPEPVPQPEPPEAQGMPSAQEEAPEA